MANTKLPARLLDTSAIPALNVTGDLTVDTTTLKVDSTNNRVGIGVAAPSFTLHVLDTIGTRTLSLGHGVSTGTITTDVAKDLNFQQAGATKMTLDSSGNLLVGTTSNSVYNDASGTGIALNAGQIQIAGTGVPLYLNRQGSDGTIAEFRKSGTTVGSIGVAASDNIYFAGATGSTKGIYINNAAVAPANTGGAALDNGVDLGASGVRFKDLYLSGTISSGAITSTGDFSTTGSITTTDGNSTFGISGDSASNTYLIATGEIRVRPSGTSVNKLVIGSNGNLTTAGTISSGAITSSSLFTNTYANGNVSAPSTSDHTAGTRQVYYDGSATAWYARGIEGNTLWDNVDQDWKLYRQAALRLHWGESAGTFSVNHGTPIVRLADTSSSGAMEMKVDGIAAYVTNKSTNGGLYLQTNNPRDQYVHINGTAFYSESFALNNGVQYDFDIDVGSEGGSGNSFFIIAGYNHFYNVSYGAHKIAFMSARTTSMDTMINVGDQSSTGGGAWQFTKPSAAVLRVRKTAGTYVGGGHGFITVIFKAL